MSTAIVFEGNRKIISIAHNMPKAMIRALGDGCYDVLVVTGGALVELLRNKQLSLDMFATVVLDEDRLSMDKCTANFTALGQYIFFLIHARLNSVSVSSRFFLIPSP